MLHANDNENDRTIHWEIAIPVVIAGLSALVVSGVEWLMDEVRYKYGSKPDEDDRDPSP